MRVSGPNINFKTSSASDPPPVARSREMKEETVWSFEERPGVTWRLLDFKHHSLCLSSGCAFSSDVLSEAGRPSALDLGRFGAPGDGLERPFTSWQVSFRSFRSCDLGCSQCAFWNPGNDNFNYNSRVLGPSKYDTD